MRGGNFYKTIVTSFMWLILGVISILGIVFSDGPGGYDPTWIVIMPMILAFAGTFSIWVLPGLAGVEQNESVNEQHIEKAKRQAGTSKLDLLLEMMDDDEREAFKQTLKRQVLSDMRLGEDGELPRQAEILWEDSISSQGTRGN